MKLSELAEIRQGENIPSKSLLSYKPLTGNYYQYLENENFKEKGMPYKYISEKELKKLNILEGRAKLKYGDYFITENSNYIIENNNRYVLRRFESNEVTIPANDIIIIQSSLGIVSEFFGYDKNRKYFYAEIQKSIRNNIDLSIAISNIEIMTDDIRELEVSDTADQLGIRKPVDKADLPFKLTQKPITLDRLLKRIQNGELLLDTEFQRRPGLWDTETKSRFIESLIVRLPVPAFYFDGSDDDHWLIIDGLQRLSTINSFINGEFALTNLDFNVELQDKRFKDLERPHQRNIEECEVFAYIIEKGTPPSVKYKIFKNINTSALKLESQEIRHAINPLKPAEFVKKVAEQEWFKNCVPTSKQDRMYDREVVLRYIAFQRTHFLDYKPTIVEFLDEAMTGIYDIPKRQIDEYEKDLERVVRAINDIMGEPCFSKNFFLNDSKIYVHNNIVFELLTYGFSKINTNLINLIKNKSIIKKDVVDFFSNQKAAFWDRDGAYTQEGLKDRFKAMQLFISNLPK